MHHVSTMEWETGKKPITSLARWREAFQQVQECVVSPDGKQLAALVYLEDETVVPCVNGEPWSNTFEKAWSLRFSPDGRLVCIGMNDDEWSVIVDDEPWEGTYTYVWNLRFSPEGASIAANIRTSDGYGVVMNGEAWERSFIEARSCEISLDGQNTAAKRAISGNSTRACGAWPSTASPGTGRF